MNLFRRSIRIFLIVAALVGTFIGGMAWFLSRLVLSPPKLPVALPPPSEVSVETIGFPAVQDGIRLSGWILPQARGEKAPTIILVHGWPWNRLGEDRQDFTRQLLKAERVDLFKLAKSLHADGYAVMMFDLRNHGESALASGGVTFGLTERLDLLGAIQALGNRSDIDMERIGVVGFSMGANTLLCALGHTDQIKAAVAVQPTTPEIFAGRLTRYMAGPLGLPIHWAASFMIKWFGGMPLEDVDIMQAASQAGQTPVLYVQSAGDQFGSLDDVQAMAAVTPNTVDLLVPPDGENRYDGYTYVINNPEILRSYFREYMP